MISDDGGIVCDMCGEEREPEGPLGVANRKARKDGWTTERDMKGGFIHMCPICKEYQ